DPRQTAFGGYREPVGDILADADRLEIARLLRAVRPQSHRALVGKRDVPPWAEPAGLQPIPDLRTRLSGASGIGITGARPRWLPSRHRTFLARAAVHVPRLCDAVGVDHERKRRSRSHVRSGLNAEVEQLRRDDHLGREVDETQAVRAVRMHAPGGATVVEY